MVTKIPCHTLCECWDDFLNCFTLRLGEKDKNADGTFRGHVCVICKLMCVMCILICVDMYLYV